MLKKIGALALMLALLVSSAAVAEVTNRDMQLMGGVLVSNSSDSYFFCPMEEGVTRHWGLYAVSSCANGPILEISDGYPARLIHADDSNVYFLGYTDGERTTHSLYSVPIGGGNPEELLTDIQSAFVEESSTFLYVTKANPYCLNRYDISKKKSTEIKDMTKSDKKMYDAIKGDDGDVYFLTLAANGTEGEYWYHGSSKKATSLDKPNPAHFTSLLYEGYRIYATGNNQAQIYSLKIGNKKGTLLAKDGPPIYLNSPRFGQYIYAYNGDGHQLVAYPIDGADRKTITLEGSTLSRLIMGGSKDEILYFVNKAIYAAPADLSSQSKVIDFDSNAAMWTHIAPAKSKAIVVFGYNADTLTYQDTMMPTAVCVYDRASGEELFSFPKYDEANPAPTPSTEMPETIGAPEEEREDETYFVF